MAPSDSTRSTLRDALARIDDLTHRLQENEAELERLREELDRLRRIISTATDANQTKKCASPPDFVLPPPLPAREARVAAEMVPKASGVEPGPPGIVSRVAAEGGTGGARPANTGPVSPRPARESTAPRSEEAGPPDLETRIGTYWFNRIGLLSLIVAFALFARTVHGLLQPWHKAVLLYGVSLAMGLVGLRLDRKLQQFARPVVAGGLSLAFFTSFAAHFIPATACLPLSASLALMLLSVGAIFTFAERWRSEPTAGLAIFFGHAAALIGSPEAGLFSAVAIALLSATAVALMVRHAWAPLHLLAVVTAFGSHALWAARAPMEASSASQFWIHVGFLSSYYLLFMTGDLLLLHRRLRAAGAAPPVIRRRVERACGPVATVLYATVATWAFFDTNLYVDRIHWFLLGLSLIQFGVAAVRTAWGGPDRSFHLAAGVAFGTLGLLNLFAGLTLNLLLAAEALLLLILARQLGLWVLNPLAQVVLAINFIHYWQSDAHRITTWPVFCGSIATSSVYLVMAWLEETWGRAAAVRSATGAKTAGGLRQRAFDWLRPALAHLHAGLAGVLLVYQCATFFPEPAESTALVVVLALLTLGLAAVPCRPWQGTMAVIYLMLIIFFAIRGADHATASAALAPTWMLHQGLGAAGAVYAAASLGWAAGCRSPFFAIIGLTHLAGSAGLSWFAADIGVGPDEWPWPAMIVPFGFWAIAVRPRLDAQPDGAWSSGWPGPLERRLLPRWSAVRAGAAVAGALLLSAAALRGASSSSQALWFLGGFTMAAVGLAGLGPPGAPAAGIVVHLAAIAFARFGWSGLDASTVSARLDGWLVFTAGAAGAVLAGIALRRRRPAVLGASLTAMGLQLLMVFRLGREAPQVFDPPWPWLFCVAGLVAGIEIVSVGLRGRDDMGWIGRHRFLIGFVAATAGALLWAWVLLSALPPGFPRWRAEWLCSGLFFVLAVMLRSPSAAAACGVHLGLSHVIYGWSLFPGDASAEAWFLASLAHPGWTAGLLTFTLAAGAAAEHALRSWRGAPPQRLAVWLRIAAGYSYLAVLAIGAVFLAAQTARLGGSPAMGWAGQLAVAPILAAAGAGLRLPYLAFSAGLHGAVTFFAVCLLAAVSPVHHPQLHLAGIAIAVQLIGIERCLFRVEPSAPVSTRLLRQGLGSMAGGMLLVTFLYSAEIGDRWTTFGWSISALTLMALGFLVRTASYRRVALAMFVAAVVRVILVDLAGRDPLYRICAFLAVGICLVLTSFLYSRYRDEFRKWL